MIRVLLVDDHVMMRQGTRALLRESPEIAIVGEAGRGEEALELARELRPDVLVLDIKLEGLSGIDVARQLRVEMPEVRILVLSAYHYEQYVRGMFAIGVDGYLLKSATAAELISGVLAVTRGESVLSEEVSRTAAPALRGGIAGSDGLSEREREVLELVSRGASNKDVAEGLGISLRTVESHMSNAMAKLGAKSRVEAISVAMQRGIVVAG